MFCIHLLQGYNPMVRPVQRHGDTINVNFTVELKQILNMDIKRQQLITSSKISVLLMGRSDFTAEVQIKKIMIFNPKDVFCQVGFTANLLIFSIP